MARSGRGRGRGGRGRPRQETQGGRIANSSGGPCRGRRTTLTAVQEAARAYQEGTDEDIRRIIQNMESSILEEQWGSETEEIAEEVTDPGNTRGRMTLYRQYLHIYWVLKRLLAKALEQGAKEMAELANGVPNIQKEMKNFQVIMINQNNKIEEMSQILSKMVGRGPSQADQVHMPMEMDQQTGTRGE